MFPYLFSYNIFFNVSKNSWNGAYLVRLGQRTIQNKSSSPIILTGNQDLNKLMGVDVYSTNDQLGGPMGSCTTTEFPTLLHWIIFALFHKLLSGSPTFLMLEEVSYQSLILKDWTTWNVPLILCLLPEFLTTQET